jgi:hypothetical protein
MANMGSFPQSADYAIGKTRWQSPSVADGGVLGYHYAPSNTRAGWLTEMKASIRQKLDLLVDRLDEIDRMLSAPGVANDMDQFRKLSRERAELEPVVVQFNAFRQAERDLAEAEAMHADPDMREFAEEEIAATKARLPELEIDLQKLLLPKDPNDEKSVILEIRAGTGGDESALFAGDLFRMYSRFAERQRWQVEVLSASESDLGGYREIICRIGRQRRLLAAEVRIRRPPRPARAGNRNPGPHPYLGVHRGGDAGSR